MLSLELQNLVAVEIGWLKHDSATASRLLIDLLELAHRRGLLSVLHGVVAGHLPGLSVGGIDADLTLL